MKRAQFAALVGVLALSIVSCGNDPSQQPGYGRQLVGKGQPEVFFNNETFTIKTGEEFQGTNFELLKDGNGKLILFSNDAKELYESLQWAPEFFAGDENLKPDDRKYIKGEIKRGDNLYCTKRPTFGEDSYVEYKCQIGIEVWWGKTAGWMNPVDSGTNHWLAGPDASKAKVQTGFTGWALALQPKDQTSGRFVGAIFLSGVEARMLYAAMGGVTAGKQKVGDEDQEIKAGPSLGCIKHYVAKAKDETQVTYSCWMGIDYQRGATLGLQDAVTVLNDVLPDSYK